MWRALSLGVSCIACSNPVVSECWKARGVSAEDREVKLGRFLCFLNTLSATHSTIRAVLAEDRWFSNLVQIVNIDTNTGEWYVTCTVVSINSFGEIILISGSALYTCVYTCIIQCSF